MSSSHQGLYQSASGAGSSQGGSETQGQQAGVGEESEGEEQDEPSSSLKEDQSQDEDELSSFRQKWQQELQNSPEHQAQTLKQQPSKSAEEDQNSIEEKAKALFLKGVQYERDRKLYEAIQFYRRAVQLVPDIESRSYEATKAKTQSREESLAGDLEEMSLDGSAVPGKEDAKQSDDDDEDEDNGNLLPRFQRHFLRDQTVCQPNVPSSGTHISSLPMEIILHIMRWVVSSELDLRALDLSCSGVCKGFYLAARDPEIWRTACVRVWGLNCGGLSNFESWRQMYIERPHLLYHGCYISKTTYIRHGENSFQDQFYRPWHLVEYYRYLRFFPEGRVLMLTTSDDPMTSLRELKHRHPRNPTVLCGHFRLFEDHVSVILKRENEKSIVANNRNRGMKRRDGAQWPESSEQTFHLELQIASHRSHRHVQLVWRGYSVITSRGGVESTTKFDLVSNRFPPFWFSRVKSYTTDSEIILQ